MRRTHKKHETQTVERESEDAFDEKAILNKKLASANKVVAEYQKLKSTFISNISHEMRTPLNAILGFSELSTMSDFNKEEMQEYMRIIHSSSKELLEKIKDVIYVASLDADMIKLEKEAVSLHGLFNVIKEHYNYEKHENTEVEIKINFASTQHVFFMGDAGKLSKTLKKLIDNGVKFSDSGCVELSFDPSDPKQLNFLVSDRGIGIPADKLQVIFEPFGTAEDSYNRNYSGSGLGLSIVQRLVKLMEGELNIDSKVGEGTSINLKLPLININNK